ncbi:MAG: thioredoxin family protein [Saprospiraceae bacterium]|nr:thioredoxin family protein [Saprospiraceae bacterium]
MKKLLFLCMSMMMVLSLAANDGDNGYKVGDTATDFELKGVDGEMYSLSDFKDVKGYVVVFTCNTCPYSVMYEDRLISLADEAKKAGFAFVAVNPNDPEVQPGDSFEKMQTRAKEKSFNFPYLFDEGQTVYPVYGATRTPHVFVMNADMKVEYIGAVDDNARDAAAVQQQYVVNAMMNITKGQPVDPSMTKAIGCSIKTKA